MPIDLLPLKRRIQKAINQAAKKNGGRPPIELMYKLGDFYEKTKKYQKVAETYETIQILNPNTHQETNIMYYYGKAGQKKLSDKWAEEAYKNNPDPISAYNLALIKEYSDPKEFERLIEEDIKGGVDSAFWIYGRYLLEKDEIRAKVLLNKAFNIWYPTFERGHLRDDVYHRLIDVAELLGKYDIAKKVRKAKNNKRDDIVKWFDEENLVTDNTQEPKIIDNSNPELPF